MLSAGPKVDEVDSDCVQCNSNQFASMTIRGPPFAAKQANPQVQLNCLYQALDAGDEERLLLDNVINDVPVLVAGRVWRTSSETIAHEDVSNADSFERSIQGSC